jgi:hypothetical protein
MCKLKGAIVAAAIVLCSTVIGSASTYQRTGQDSDPAVQQVLDDYIGLYRVDTLERWKTLFLPGFVASYTNDDGSVTTRTLDAFYERQRTTFAAGPVAETLSNVRVNRVGRLAQVFADFRFTSRGVTRPGQLMLLMLEDKGQMKIAALIFTYHLQ